MLNKELLEQQLAQLPLYVYEFIDPAELEFSDRVRWICEHECPMYGKSWACPPGVGTVEACKGKCLSYNACLLVGTITEPEDFYSIDLMSAYSSLGTIIGEEVGEDLVNEIFTKFCMGK